MPKKQQSGTPPAIRRTVKYPSLTGRKDKDGDPIIYTVTVHADGTARCTCPDFYIGTNKRKDPLYRCKHVELEIGSKGRAKDKPSRVPVTREEQPKVIIDILGDEVFEPRVRRGR